jgi:hypothetical protein
VKRVVIADENRTGAWFNPDSGTVWLELSVWDQQRSQRVGVYSGANARSELCRTRLNHWVLHTYRPCGNDRLFSSYRQISPEQATGWLGLSRHRLPPELDTVPPAQSPIVAAKSPTVSKKGTPADVSI